MKHQLIELLKKANEGVSATPNVIKELIREYQMASIGYLVFGVLLLAIATIGLIFLLKGFADKKEWAAEHHTYDNSYSVTTLLVTSVCISGTLVLIGIIIVLCKIGPAFAPAWYMIESLMN
jgi:uncharacterized membrane protein